MKYEATKACTIRNLVKVVKKVGTHKMSFFDFMYDCFIKNEGASGVSICGPMPDVVFEFLTLYISPAWLVQNGFAVIIEERNITIDTVITAKESNMEYRFARWGNTYTLTNYSLLPMCSSRWAADQFPLTLEEATGSLDAYEVAS